MIVLLDVLTDLPPENSKRDANPLDDQLDQWSRTRDLADIPPSLALRAITTWSRLHGLVSLEIEGNFASMGIDPERLFDAEVTAILNGQA